MEEVDQARSRSQLGNMFGKSTHHTINEKTKTRPLTTPLKPMKLKQPLFQNPEISNAALRLSRALQRPYSINGRYYGNWNLVKTLTVEIADLLLGATNQDSPPIDLGPICKLLNIEVKDVEPPTEDPTSPHGTLRADSEGFTIETGSSNGELTRRATIAHEIGHAFFL
jgi:hypothetical protein